MFDDMDLGQLKEEKTRLQKNRENINAELLKIVGEIERREGLEQAEKELAQAQKKVQTLKLKGVPSEERVGEPGS